MPTVALLPLDQTLPSVTFERLQRVFCQMAASLQPGEFLTTADLDPAVAPPTWYGVITSKQLQALLKGVSSNGGADYQVQLTFDPETIATFLADLQAQYTQYPRQRTVIEQVTATLEQQASQGTCSLTFVAQLLQVLSEGLSPAQAKPTAVACQPMVDAALYQQVAQERLLNHVATQIRQSLELPVIINTAIAEVREFLQADRLVIYQFFPVEQPCSNGKGQTQPELSELSRREGPSPTAQVGLEQGCVTYEALASASIPSVLGDLEKFCWGIMHECRAKYSQGFTLAVDDVEHNYPTAPCLLDFLRQIQVRAKLVTPIQVQSRLWGLLIAHQCSGPRPWQDYEKSLLQRIGEHLAIAIYQAKLYQQLQAQKQTLEDQVHQRTQELHEALLAAQSANQVKGDFLATMSHELRTPLTCVIGLSATLLRWSLGPLTDKQRSYLQTIHDNGGHLLDLINDILELSQTESGTATLNLSEFSLSSLVEQNLQMLRDEAHSQNVTLKSVLMIPPERDRFVADPRRVKLILYNLLDNAIKFTPAGGNVTLKVSAEPKTVIFQVEDTGIGIPVELQPQLFQAFQQLDTSYHRNYQGTGLGLALVKQLVDLHHGRIEVNSVEGQGSTFRIELPNQVLIAGSELRTVRAEAASPGGRVILIEPDEEIASLICDMLTAAGYQVIWWVEASTALEQISLLHPVALILDFQSLDLDNPLLIQRLFQVPNTDSTKIVLLTTETTLTQKPQLVAGADAYLVKPIDPERLVYQLAQLLEPSVGNRNISLQNSA